MKEWIEENKYIAGLLGVLGFLVLLLGGGIYLNISGKSETTASIAKLDGEAKNIKKKLGNPTEASLSSLQTSLNDRVSQALDVYAKSEAVGSHALNLGKSDTDFTGLLKAYVRRNKATLSEAGVAHTEAGMFGFNAYGECMIVKNPKAIGLALYQMDAFDALFKTIAKIKPQALHGVYRPATKEESEERTRVAKGAKKKAIRRLPFELSLSMTEAQLTQFIEEVVNSKEHFFVIKSIRLTSSKVDPIAVPKIMLGVEPAAAAQPKPADDFSFEPEDGDMGEDGESEEPEAPAKVEKGAKILEQVLGKESMRVSLIMEVLLIEDAKKLSLKPLKITK